VISLFHSHFTSKVTANGNYWLGGWWARADVDMVAERKSSNPCRNQTSISQSSSQSLQLLIMILIRYSTYKGISEDILGDKLSPQN
jgi:hypothetical protein